MKCESRLADEYTSIVAPCDLSKLTIVIPTYNRPDFLLRQIIYLSKWRVSVEIVDGSDNPLESNIQELIKKFPHINYRHYKLSYPDRVFHACKRIQTPYAMCLADDDFYLQSGLASALNALEIDGCAVACMGQAVGFDRLLDKGYYFEYGSNLIDYSITNEAPLERILQGVRNYRSATSYAVFRKSTFLNIWGRRDGVSCLEAVEYEHAIRTYLCGSLITTRSIYWLRSFEAQPVGSWIDGNRAINFQRWWCDPHFSSEFDIFKERLIGLFVNIPHISLADASNLFDLIVKLIDSGSHSSFVGKNRFSFMFENLIGIIKMSPYLNRLKCKLIWGKIKPYIRYLGRKKIKLIGISSSTNELIYVLKFVDSFNFESYKK